MNWLVYVSIALLVVSSLLLIGLIIHKKNKTLLAVIVIAVNIVALTLSTIRLRQSDIKNLSNSDIVICRNCVSKFSNNTCDNCGVSIMESGVLFCTEDGFSYGSIGALYDNFEHFSKSVKTFNIMQILVSIDIIAIIAMLLLLTFIISHEDN